MAIWRALALAFAVTLTAGPALAGDEADKAEKEAAKAAKQEEKAADKADKRADKAPEINPTGLGGALTMLVGGVFLFGVAKRRKS